MQPNLSHEPGSKTTEPRRCLKSPYYAPSPAPPSLATFAALLATTVIALAASYAPSRIVPPEVAREMRAAWVATVANLDWPSTNALSTARQKAELLAILDRAAELKLNAIIFQVRPSCDAMYASTLEPWSEYLTGTMGKAPEPFYDPLAFAVEEAHKRGLELHAWFNPYRARHIMAKSPIAPSHISRTRPDLVRQFGKVLWLDPGEKDVQDYSLSVVMDVVKRYDIDGVAFDDYFYPDKRDSGTEQDFPDDTSWKRFGSGLRQTRDDWRRDNVNRFIERAYDSIKFAKPQVKFGISPFGIWRPKNPPQIKGKDAYAEHYADSRLWLVRGWLDYFSPQLYWPIGQPDQSFPVLLKWWEGQNTKGRLLCPGLNTYNVGRTWQAEDIVSQIRLARRQSGVSGHLHWRMSALMQNHSLDDALEREVYAQPALMPLASWLGQTRPQKPMLVITNGEGGQRLKFSWAAGGVEKPWLWVLQTRRGGVWTAEILPGNTTDHLSTGSPPEVVAVLAVDRVSNASRAAVQERRK